MFYKKTKLRNEEFRDPPSEYRGTPFWAWNCKMNEDIVDDFVKMFKEMGMGGAHIHSRTGLDTEYLSDEFMSLIKHSNEKFKENGMLCWLYDEDRWPSGYGGGYVTANKKYRMKYLSFVPSELREEKESRYSSSATAIKGGERTLLRRYAVTLCGGYLTNYRVLSDDEKCSPGEKEWAAYLCVSGDSPWFNNQAYVDTLSKEAIEKFIEVTHEKYYREAGEDFGKSIPAIFTDEPQFLRKGTFGFAEEEKEVCIPFTDGFDDAFFKKYGYSILDCLPEVFWQLPNNDISVKRYHYHDFLAERFASSFADTVGEWCDRHGIMLTGHMMDEPTLSSQTAALGEAMRSYRAFKLPGVDMLCHSREFTTLKQAQSAAHQFGRPGVASELYGVTNWDFDFKGHKLHGDWQAALGVSVRVHHLSWSSMKGEAKRDYPATIGYQSPWYRDYKYIEDYFSRVNYVMTSGTPEIKIGVIHPVESMWLCWGPLEQTQVLRKQLDGAFLSLTEWLLYGLCDFNFISESLLPGLQDGTKVGKMEYDVIIVPNCITLRGTTLEFLKKCRKEGKKIIFTGKTPTYLNGEHSDSVRKFVSECDNVLFDKSEILSAVEKYKTLDIRTQNGIMTDNLICQLRKDGEDKYLFISHVKKQYDDIPKKEDLVFTVDGIWDICELNALEGKISDLAVYHKDGKTCFKKVMYEHDSLLLKLTAAQNEIPETQQESAPSAKRQKLDIPLFLNYRLEEDNVLLVDMAEYRFDDGEWQRREEILKIDNLFRKKLSYPLRTEAYAQPWVNSSKNENSTFEHTLSLRITVDSEIEVKDACFAMEGIEKAKITLNNKVQKKDVVGYYVDKGICKIKLDTLNIGKNELTVEIPYNSKTDVEYMYITGNFGVKAVGSTAKIVTLPKEITFGDIREQNLAFYGGNIVYEFDVDTPCEGELTVSANKFRSPVLKVAADGKFVGYIAFSPYTLRISNLEAGKHRISITACGNRFNTFGQLHNCDDSTTWYGPNSWRTEGASFSYEYCLRPTGLLRAPDIFFTKK